MVFLRFLLQAKSVFLLFFQCFYDVLVLCIEFFPLQDQPVALLFQFLTRVKNIEITYIEDFKRLLVGKIVVET